MSQQASRRYAGRHRRGAAPTRRGGKAVIAGLGVTALALPLTAGAANAGVYDLGTMSRASVGNSGQQIAGLGGLDSVSDLGISTGGRYVSFVSQSPSLVARDTNGTDPDVFVRDRVSGKTYLVSLDTNGQQAPPFSGDFDDYRAANPVLAGSAPYIAYVFRAQQSHSYDRPFLRNLKTGATVELPHLDNFTRLLDISSDGRYVLMTTSDEEFPGSGLWVYDAATRKATAVGFSDDLTFFNAASISDDGRYIAYDVIDGSTAENQVFRVDRLHPDASPSLVSVGLGGHPANGVSSTPSISANGRYIAFRSDATNLVPGDTNGVTDVFVRDLLTGSTQRASVTTGGKQANLASWPQSISASGRQVAFTSAATNLVSGDTNRHTDVFVRQLGAKVTTRVSVATTGKQLDKGATSPVLSGDGKHIGFLTLAAMVKADTNGLTDAYVRDVTPAH